MNSISSLFTDPKIQQIKKLVFEISKTKYVENEEIIERLCSLILTKHDGEKFIKLIMDIYESGYKKSVNDQREVLEKLGYSVKITGTQSENAG